MQANLPGQGSPKGGCAPCTRVRQAPELAGTAASQQTLAGWSQSMHSKGCGGSHVWVLTCKEPLLFWRRLQDAVPTQASHPVNHLQRTTKHLSLSDRQHGTLNSCTHRRHRDHRAQCHRQSAVLCPHSVAMDSNISSTDQHQLPLTKLTFQRPPASNACHQCMPGTCSNPPLDSEPSPAAPVSGPQMRARARSGTWASLVSKASPKLPMTGPSPPEVQS